MYTYKACDGGGIDVMGLVDDIEDDVRVGFLESKIGRGESLYLPISRVDKLTNSFDKFFHHVWKLEGCATSELKGLPRVIMCVLTWRR